jgi:hypothetical protein
MSQCYYCGHDFKIKMYLSNGMKVLECTFCERRATVEDKKEEECLIAQSVFPYLSDQNVQIAVAGLKER